MNNDLAIHHRRSMRLKDYDYSSGGAYFVTICASRRRCLFGEIIGGAMHRNGVGDMVEQSWQWLATQYSHVELDHFVLMPNHLHGIILMHEAQGEQQKLKPLGRLIGAFKTTSTKRINNAGGSGSTVWQRNYYERVLRDEKELELAREYIVNNPLKWDLDKENPSNAGGRIC